MGSPAHSRAVETSPTAAPAAVMHAEGCFSEVTRPVAARCRGFVVFRPQPSPGLFATVIVGDVRSLGSRVAGYVAVYLGRLRFLSHSRHLPARRSANPHAVRAGPLVGRGEPTNAAQPRSIEEAFPLWIIGRLGTLRGVVGVDDVLGDSAALS